MYGKWSDIDAISGNADFVRYDLYAKCYCQAGYGGSGLSKYMVGRLTHFAQELICEKSSIIMDEISQIPM